MQSKQKFALQRFRVLKPRPRVTPIVLFLKSCCCVREKKYFPKLPPSNYIVKNPAKMLPSNPPKKHIHTPEEFHSHSLLDNFLFIPFMVLKATLYILAGKK